VPKIDRDDVNFYIYDTGVGWAALTVDIGYIADGDYEFSLIWDPLDNIRQFERDLRAGEPARMILRGEPGAVEVFAKPMRIDGWVRLRIWLINHRDDRELDLDAACPAEFLADSLRSKTGFLAKEVAKDEGPEQPPTLLQRFWNWLKRD
jgi:hypothetical protein